MSKKFQVYPHLSSELTAFATTIYVETLNEPDDIYDEGQEWVGWVIKNRAHSSRSKWPDSIKKVCLQFECLSAGKIEVNKPDVYDKVLQIAKSVMNSSYDPTGGCDNYSNPSKENPDWINDVYAIRRIKNLVFYKSFSNSDSDSICSFELDCLALHRMDKEAEARESRQTKKEASGENGSDSSSDNDYNNEGLNRFDLHPINKEEKKSKIKKGILKRPM